MKLLTIAFFFSLIPLSISAQCSEIWVDDNANWIDDKAGWIGNDEVCPEVLPFVIYPNPTTDYFEVKNALDTEGVIYSPIGKRIRRVSLTGIIDVSDLSKGVYLLVNRTNTAKFVVQ